MKEWIITALGAVGSAIAAAFGGWSAAITTLTIFMAIDYISGLIVAGVFYRSPKTDTGALESRAGFKGLIRKGCILVMVLIGHRLDMIFGGSYIKDGVCVAFIANELLSIVENAGLMGVPIPKIIAKAIDMLKKRAEEEKEKEEKTEKDEEEEDEEEKAI